LLQIPHNGQEKERCLMKLKTVLDVLEEDFLSKHKYMWGNEYSLADIFYMPMMHVLFMAGAGDLISSRWRVAKWWATVSVRPAWRSVIEPFDDFYAMIGGQREDS
jgi:glutathione S-transferase